MFTPQVKPDWGDVVHGAVSFCLRFILSLGGESYFPWVGVYADKDPHLVWQQEINEKQVDRNTAPSL